MSRDLKRSCKEGRDSDRSRGRRRRKDFFIRNGLSVVGESLAEVEGEGSMRWRKRQINMCMNVSVISGIFLVDAMIFIREGVRVDKQYCTSIR